MRLTKYSKELIIDHFWTYSKSYSYRLYGCQELFNLGYGDAALSLLLMLFESVSKSVIKDFDSSAYQVYERLRIENLVTEDEYQFINIRNFSLRKLRNLLAHANLGATCLVVDESGDSEILPFTENETFLFIYSKISHIVFNLIFKICGAPYSEPMSDCPIDLSDDINSCNYIIKVFTSKELLSLKGFPEDYLSDLDIPEDVKIRLIENEPDLNMWKVIFESIQEVPSSSENET